LEHLTAVWKMSGRKPADLEIPEIPRELTYIWKWYHDMRTPEGLTCTDMDAWERVYGVVLQTREADLLKSIDAVRAKVAREDA
jgi:hypothetical protein